MGSTVHTTSPPYHGNKPTRAADTHAGNRRVGFEEPGGTRLARRLFGGSSDCAGVLARRTLGVGGAAIGLGAAGRRFHFDKSGRTHLALVGTGTRLDVFARWALNFLDGGAGVSRGAADRRRVFEESLRA